MAEAGGDHNIIIEFDALANELENMMNATNLTMSPQCCIFKVPNILSRHNPRAYGEEHLKATQKIKLRYLHDLISSFPDTNPKAMLRTLIGAIREVQEEARDCYADPFDHISMYEFVKILVLDGCFLIQLFRKRALNDFPYIFHINPQRFSHSATEFFNQLYDDTYVKELYYTPLIQKVNNYCLRSWPKYRTILMHDNFRHPWALISVVAAAFLLILAFLQTVFSIIK